jgi:hemoglobin/transferrin/lactoferrin receptor protein
MSFAGFVNWVWSVNEQLTLNLGARVTTTSLEARWKEYYNINALLSNVRLDTKALTSTLAITYRPSNKTQWNVIVSDGFRNPNIDDIGKIRENKGVLIVPNPNLFPEYAYNFELGLTRYLKESKNYLDFRGFTTLISRHIGRDFYTIFADKTNPDLSTILYNGSEVITMSNNNMGNRFLVGASAEGKLELLETLQLQGNLSYINALKNDKYGPLPSISPIFGSVLLHYSKDQWFSQLRFQFSGSKDPSQYSFGGEDGLEETPLLVEELDQYAGTPGWNTFSWMAQYNWNEQIRFRFALDNIFDQHYRTFASGISAPGRNLSLGVHLQF